jgi:hypothetical protein
MFGIELNQDRSAYIPLVQNSHQPTAYIESP